MTTTDPAAREAAIFLLSERAREHDQKAGRAKIATVYVSSTPPRESTDDALKIAERAYLESIVAEALYNQREAERFERAIEAIKAANNEQEA